MRRHTINRRLFGISVAATAILAATATGGSAPRVDLYKIVTVKDEIVIGLTDADFGGIAGRDAGTVGGMLARDGELSAWRYAVRKAADGELELAPLHRVSVLAHESLRVEPYPTPLRVVPVR